MAPVQLWDFVQDPLDVDKQKQKTAKIKIHQPGQQMSQVSEQDQETLMSKISVRDYEKQQAYQNSQNEKVEAETYYSKSRPQLSMNDQINSVLQNGNISELVDNNKPVEAAHSGADIVRKTTQENLQRNLENENLIMQNNLEKRLEEKDRQIEEMKQKLHEAHKISTFSQNGEKLTPQLSEMEVQHSTFQNNEKTISRQTTAQNVKLSHFQRQIHENSPEQFNLLNNESQETVQKFENEYKVYKPSPKNQLTKNNVEYFNKFQTTNPVYAQLDTQVYSQLNRQAIAADQQQQNMSMFDIEMKNSSVTKSIEKQANQITESILPKKLYNDAINGKDSTVPSTTVGGNGTGMKSTLSVKSHVMQYMANTDKLLAKIKKPETDINEIPRDQSLNLSGLEIKNTNKSTIPKEDDKSYVEITNIDQSPDFMQKQEQNAQNDDENKETLKVQQITHKNILSKKTLQALNETQKVFPSLKERFGQSFDSKSGVSSTNQSNLTTTRRRSSKIGGLAKRINRRESIAQIKMEEELNRDLSVRNSSLDEHSEQDQITSKQETAVVLPELTQSAQVTSLQIQVTVKNPTPEKVKEESPKTPTVKMADAEAHVFQTEIDGDLLSKESMGKSIQAKLSIEEDEFKKELEKNRKLDAKDEFGCIAIQTSSKTLPGVISDKGDSRQGKRIQNDETKNETDIFYSQIVKGELEPQSPPATAQTVAAEVPSDQKQENKTFIKEASQQFEEPTRFNIRRTSRQHNRMASELSQRKKELLAKTITDIKVVPLYHDHPLDQELEQKLSTALEQRKNSVLDGKDSEKLVYLPYLITNREKSGIKEETKREKVQESKKNDESDMRTEQNVKLPEVIGEEDPPPVVEKHHKDKSKCPICIRKRALRKKEKEEKEKKKLQELLNNQSEVKENNHRDVKEKASNQDLQTLLQKGVLNQSTSKIMIQESTNSLPQMLQQKQYYQGGPNNNNPQFTSTFNPGAFNNNFGEDLQSKRNLLQQQINFIDEQVMMQGNVQPNLQYMSNNQSVSKMNGVADSWGQIPNVNQGTSGFNSGFQQNFQNSSKANFGIGLEGVNGGQNQKQVTEQSNTQLPMLNPNGMSNYNPAEANMDISKPINKYYQTTNREVSHPLKYFKGQDLEMYYMEKQLKPEVEKEIKEGFFEIKKKYDEGGGSPTNVVGPNGQKDDEVQVYVSHLCLHNFHPIFCKFDLETVKIILHYSSIVYLQKGQTLYSNGFNDNFVYIVLYGRVRLYHSETHARIGNTINIGWTVGEEILFKSDQKKQRKDLCKAATESCVLGIEKKNLTLIKKLLGEKNKNDEFVKLEVVLRGNHLVKKNWYKN